MYCWKAPDINININCQNDEKIASYLHVSLSISEEASYTLFLYEYQNIYDFIPQRLMLNGL